TRGDVLDRPGDDMDELVAAARVLQVDGHAYGRAARVEVAHRVVGDHDVRRRTDRRVARAGARAREVRVRTDRSGNRGDHGREKDEPPLRLEELLHVRSSSLKGIEWSRPWLADQTGGNDRAGTCPSPRGAAIWSPGRSPSCARETLSQRLNGERDEQPVECDGDAFAAGPPAGLSRLSSYMTPLCRAARPRARGYLVEDDDRLPQFVHPPRAELRPVATGWGSACRYTRLNGSRAGYHRT